MVNSFLKKGPLFLAFIFCCITSGCDVPGKIEIVNQTNEAAIYRYTATDGKIVDVELKNKGMKSVILMGFGNYWTDQGIRDYVSKLQRIDIITKHDTTVVQGQEEMTKFFKKARRGLLKDTIKIVIH